MADLHRRTRPEADPDAMPSADAAAPREHARELERSRALTRIAGSIARLGGWSVEVPSRAVLWSEELFDVLGWEGEEAPTLDQGLAMYDDAELVAAAVEACATDGTPFDLEVTARTFAGQRMWARVAGLAQRDDEGRIVRVVGAFQDVTASQQVVDANAALTTRLTRTFESITDAVYTLDREWRFTYLNPQAERLVRRSADDLLGRVVWDEFPEAADTELFELFGRAVVDRTPVRLDAYPYPPLDTVFEITAYPSADGLAVYFRDVRDRIAREQELQRAAADEQERSARLRELDDTKNAFLSAVSHELRTPLTVVHGLGQTLQRLRGHLDDGHRAEIEDAIVANAGRLEQLLTDLLDVDRLAHGTLRSRQVPCDLSAVVTAAVSSHDAAERVALEVPATLPITADPTQIERIVVNLLENAAKYAPTGTITVRVVPLDLGGRIEVIDEGPGIPDGERERIFEPLYRIDDDHPRPGTGIGLSLVAAFARLHAGRARAVPAATGAHLQVDLPDRRADEAQGAS